MRKSKYKWVVLLLVSMTYFLAQGTRLIYSAVLPQIKADFASSGISDTKLGLVGSTFTLVFGLMMPLAGLAADLLRRKWVLVTGTFLFALGIFMSGFATGLGMLFITYGIINAVGQALLPPCNSSLISEYHDNTRGTAFGIYQSAIYIGIVVCSVISGHLANANESGWRLSFWIFGGIALVWALVVMFALKDSPRLSGGGEEGLKSVGEAFKSFVEKPSSLILMAALGCYFFATYGFKAWAPMFMMRSFPDIDPAKAVFHAVFWFYLGAFVGVNLGGRISDVLKAQRPAVRFEVELAGMLLCIPFILLMALTENLALMIIAILMFGFATGVYDSNLYAALFDVVNPRYRAVATGLFGCGGCIVGAFGPAVMGFLNDTFSARISMASLAVFAIVGAACILYARIARFEKDRLL